MKKKFKPTLDDCRILRACAEKDVGRGVIMRPGSRHHIGEVPLHREPPADGDLNIAHYTNTFPEWDDTDLADNCYAFADFKSGKYQSLTEEGNGIFDFYLYKRTGVGRDYDEELDSNLTAYYVGGKLDRVECTGFNKPLWQDGAFTDARKRSGGYGG